MKKISIVLLLIALLFVQTVAVCALTAYEAKDEWKDLRQVSKDLQQEHRDAKVKFAGNKSDSNRQEVVDTGKEVLHAALDEVEAWLIWKDLEAQENDDVPDDIKDSISEDVDANLDKIEELRTDVDGIENQLRLGLVFLKMIGKYSELLTDVARNSGYLWVYKGNTLLDKAEDYEAKLRDAAENIEDNEEILDKLDEAVEALEEARENVEKAEGAYEEVVLPGTPLIKFSEGNNYLRVARTNLLSAHSYMNQAYRLMLESD